MGKQGDAYPDPREMRSGNLAKLVLCIGLILICLGSSIAMVAAPDSLPDPNCFPDPIFNEHPNNGLPVMTSIVGSRPIFVM
jgi:hypothetical protein